MERAARLLNQHKYSRGLLDPDECIRAIWPAAVGKAIARHTTRLNVVRNTLVVGIQDAIWLFMSESGDRVSGCLGTRQMQRFKGAQEDQLASQEITRSTNSSIRPAP